MLYTYHTIHTHLTHISHTTHIIHTDHISDTRGRGAQAGKKCVESELSQKDKSHNRQCLSMVLSYMKMTSNTGSPGFSLLI